jgi:cell shape-determining protein MreC
VVTAGWSDPATGLSSAYPPGIAVGAITETSAADVDFQQVTVEPFVDVQELTFVQVLTGGPKRPGIDGEDALP